MSFGLKDPIPLFLWEDTRYKILQDTWFVNAEDQDLGWEGKKFSQDFRRDISVRCWQS